MNVAQVLSHMERTWITSEGARAEALRTDGETVRVLRRLDRGNRSIRAVCAGVLLALRERPQLVVTTGAGLVVPFAVTARLLGARLVFIETMARVRRGSTTGRFLRRIGAEVLVQWPGLTASYPGAVVCFPTLLEGVPRERAGDRGAQGTFVTVGSHDEAFDRLLEAVDDAADRQVLPGPLHVQFGVSGRTTRHGETAAYVTPREFAERMAGAAVVVTHGGAGAMATALRNGIAPVVMPRRAELGEHVDDHQVELTDLLARLDMVVPVEDSIEERHLRASRELTFAGLDELADLPRVPDALARMLAERRGSARRARS
ncbi:glycosyltransferase [Modestobacter sp. VKM Ac-2977]|uniref:glycosyltransferase n=1 Tax=Modestobacter sp. VKM Ac-2977 TaxID=3004131 RepID=UPI0022AAFB36|nr:glycosyltransferase [Modestobacter sp. VKM Ac-2977]MCZ2822744.1 glycosyltransferase [Modestobacter sp. VKM Ac-2977]